MASVSKMGMRFVCAVPIVAAWTAKAVSTSARGGILRGVLLCIPALLIAASSADAATRDTLLARLNTKIGDASNVMLTQVAKIHILNEVGHDFCDEHIYTKRDTIVTAANTDTYAANTDFAGAIRFAFARMNGSARRWLKVIDQEGLIGSETGEQDDVNYIYVDTDQRIGVKGMPTGPESLFVTYYAYPAALSAGSTEWDLPEGYEGAALKVAAGRCLQTVKTATSQQRGMALESEGWADLERKKNPTTTTRQAGDTP